MKCIFVSDLHGIQSRFDKLFKIIEKEKPQGVFIGGDVLPGGFGINISLEDFFEKTITKNLVKIKKKCKDTRFFIILGNDDPRLYESLLLDIEKEGLIEYIHNKTVTFENLYVTGYSYIPPTPFKLKDCEKFDVSQYVDIGAISPLEGIRSVDISSDKILYSTIGEDLDRLSNNAAVKDTIFLFHSPPYKSFLDRADLDGKIVEHAPVDLHVGSIAILRFIKKKQPLLTLHGHVHESTRLTGHWKEKIGNTFCFNAAHDGLELSLIRFDTDNLEDATRILI